MSWLETQDEQEVELPDLSNEHTNEVVGGPVESPDVNNTQALDNVNVDSAGQPLSNEVPVEGDSQQPNVAVPAPVVPVNNPR